MKIGIITWYGTGNFGTDLQSYALCHYLAQKGHEVKLIQLFNYKELGLKYTIKRFLGSYKRLFLIYFNSTKAKKARYSIIQHYKKDKLSIYPLVTTIHQYKNMMDYFDCFITGSDQIWNPYYLNEFNLLDFNNSKPCFAYASSIGVNEIPSDKYHIYQKHISKFKAIGVREQSGANALKKVTGNNNIVTVLDPTFLLTNEEWIRFSEQDKDFTIPCSDYMLVYTIGSRKNYPKLIKKIRDYYKISKVLVVSSVESDIIYNADFVLEKVSPMAFIKLLNKAKLVCTDSFHATALCINLNKDFIELLRFDDKNKTSQNSRIKNILEHYIINDRIYEGSTLPHLNIDFNNVNKILEKDRFISYNFIRYALSLMTK